MERYGAPRRGSCSALDHSDSVCHSPRWAVAGRLHVGHRGMANQIRSPCAVTHSCRLSHCQRVPMHRRNPKRRRNVSNKSPDCTACPFAVSDMAIILGGQAASQLRVGPTVPLLQAALTANATGDHVAVTIDALVNSKSGPARHFNPLRRMPAERTRQRDNIGSARTRRGCACVCVSVHAFLLRPLLADQSNDSSPNSHKQAKPSVNYIARGAAWVVMWA